MIVQGHQTKSTMTKKDMSKSFLPIILFSIVLPFIDIGTDLRMIIRLYSGISGCIPYEYEERIRLNVSYDELISCETTGDLSTFCQQDENRRLCQIEDHSKFATLLLGKL